MPNLDVGGPANPGRPSLGSPSEIQRVGHDERPLKVIDPSASTANGGARDPLGLDLARPLTPPAGHPGSDVGEKRRVMRPTALEGPETPAVAVPRAMPDALLMAQPEAIPPARAPEKPARSDEIKQASLPEVPAPAAPSIEPPTTPPPSPASPTPPATPASAAGSPSVRMVNTKRIVLNYEVKDVGPSGVSTVELWYTRNGQDWQKDENARVGPPCVTEVNEEGMYGFTMVAKSGLGLGQTAPQRGDLPQVWVEVDLTNPVVNLHEVKHGIGPKAREITINWSTTDRNLSRRPITLAFAETAEGPWTPLAANMENTGRYVWNMPPSAPPSFFVKVEATDLVGNVGSAVTAKPISIDLSRPKINLLGVESAGK